MSPINRTLDARGLPCPQPVILARKALAEGGFDTLEITVDDAASRENLLKFGAYAKCQVEEVTSEGTVTTLRMTPQGVYVPGTAPAPAPLAAPGAAWAATILITADGIGQGDPDLARLLMRGFLYTLTEAERLPQRVIFMNSGVKLAVAGSDSLANLNKLGERGVEVLSCGTCLESYGLTATLAVGGITNMYEIAGHLLDEAMVTIG
jgi:selenium metabolism protein YedF